MSSIAYKFAHKRVLVIEEVVEEWRIDHEQANRASAIEELVSETFDTMECIKRVVATCERGLRPETKTGEIVHAHLIGSLLEKALDLLPKVISLAEDIRRLHYIVDKLDDLSSLEGDLTGIRSRFAKKWLLPDKQKIRTAKRELTEGKYRVL